MSITISPEMSPRHEGQNRLEHVSSGVQAVELGALPEQSLTVNPNTVQPLENRADVFARTGIDADLLLIVSAGNQNYGIFDVVGEVYEEVSSQDDNRFMIVPLSDVVSDGTEGGVDYTVDTSIKDLQTIKEPDTKRMIRRNNPSRDFDSDKLGHDLGLSRHKHLSIRFTAQGVELKDEGSLNGTSVLFGGEKDANENRTRPARVISGLGMLSMQSLDTIAKPFIDARSVMPDEIVREKGNNGVALNQVYIENQERVRGYFVDHLEAGDLYAGSVEDFSNKLQAAHKAASDNNVYDQVGKGSFGITEGNRGSIRTGGELINHRLKAARQAATIAEQYGDPYATRLENDGTYQFKLPGIPQAATTEDTMRGGAYEYVYPDSGFIPDYFREAQSIGVAIQDAISSPESTRDSRGALDLIARQYQYLAIARPFDQINNSLFMNLANSQVKMLGMKGIAHGQLDLIAQRLGPDSFARYFSDTVMNQQ